MITSFLSGTQSIDVETNDNRVLFKVRDNKSNTLMFEVPIDNVEQFMEAFNAQYRLSVKADEIGKVINHEQNFN